MYSIRHGHDKVGIESPETYAKNRSSFWALVNQLQLHVFTLAVLTNLKVLSRCIYHNFLKVQIHQVNNNWFHVKSTSQKVNKSKGQQVKRSICQKVPKSKGLQVKRSICQRSTKVKNYIYLHIYTQN